VKSATSTCAWRFATFAARVDSTRATIDALWASACFPCHAADW
jgi:hypothetical protein